MPSLERSGLLQALLAQPPDFDLDQLNSKERDRGEELARLIKRYSRHDLPVDPKPKTRVVIVHDSRPAGPETFLQGH